MGKPVRKTVERKGSYGAILHIGEIEGIGDKVAGSAAMVIGATIDASITVIDRGDALLGKLGEDSGKDLLRGH